MSNASTVRRQVSGTQQLTLASVTNPSTTETNFALNNNGLTLTGGGVIPLTAGVTGLYAGTGQVLHIRLAGSYSGVTAASTTIDIKLYEVSAATIAAGGLTQTSQTGFVKIADSGAVATTQTAGGFTLDCFVQLSANGNLTGQFTSAIDHVNALISTALSTDVTGLVGEADLNFVASVTLGTSEPTTSVITLNEFAIDLE